MKHPLMDRRDCSVNWVAALPLRVPECFCSSTGHEGRRPGLCTSTCPSLRLAGTPHHRFQKQAHTRGHSTHESWLGYPSAVGSSTRVAKSTQAAGPSCRRGSGIDEPLCHPVRRRIPSRAALGVGPNSSDLPSTSPNWSVGTSPCMGIHRCRCCMVGRCRYNREKCDTEPRAWILAVTGRFRFCVIRDSISNCER